MNPWIAKAVVLAGTVVMIAIRAPHGHRSQSVKVAKSRKTPLETGLLVVAWVGFFVPLIWIASPAFSFAEYPLRTGPLVAGVMCFVIGLWLFHRSHADLGTNWSPRDHPRALPHQQKSFFPHPPPHIFCFGFFFYSPGQGLLILNWGPVPLNLVRFPVPLRSRGGGGRK